MCVCVCVSWVDGTKGNLNEAAVSSGLVLRKLVVSIDCCLGFCTVLSCGCSYIWCC